MRLGIYQACLLVFLGAVFTVAIDVPVSEFFHQILKPWDSALQWVSTMGDGRMVALLIVCAWFLPWCRGAYRSKLPVIAALSALFAFVAVQILKIVFGRPRPYLMGDASLHALDCGSFSWFRIAADFNSFPSGHTAVSFALAWTLYRRWPSSVARIGVPVFTALVAFSRVALAKHFISDVVAAGALGVACAELVGNRFRVDLPSTEPIEAPVSEAMKQAS